MLIRKNIYISESEIHNYGVFSKDFIKKGELVEECHFIDISSTIELNSYRFPFKSGFIFPIGLCTSLNSSHNTNFLPNMTFDIDSESKIIRFFSTSDINIGDELLLWYLIF